MPSLRRPGVYIDEILSPAAAISSPNSGVAAFLAPHTRGPVRPVYLESWSEFQQQFGGFGLTTQYLPIALHQFFSNGGRGAWVMRVAAAAATSAARILNDATNPTLTVTADNPGTWGQQIYVEIVQTVAGRFDLNVYYGGTTPGNIVERWPDLTMLTNDPRYAPNLINSVTAGSYYITVTDMNSATVDRRPANTGTPQALTGGTDVPVTVPGDITAAATGYTLLDTIEGPLTINMPGIVDTTAQDGLLSYCAARGDCFAVLDPAENSTVAAVTAYATARNSAFGATYYPWIYVADPVGAQGSMRKVPPGGAVVGQYATTDTLRGPWKAPAGISNRLAGAMAVEAKLTNTDLDSLNTSQVNAIRQMPGFGVCIMGARTLKPTMSDRYISTRRTLNYIRKALLDGTRWAIFEPNDSTLWGGLATNIQAFLLSIWQRRGLRGNSAAEAFYVKCDSSNNTPQSIAAGQVNIEVGVALQFPSEFVVIRIGQWEGGSTATVTL